MKKDGITKFDKKNLDFISCKIKNRKEGEVKFAIFWLFQAVAFRASQQ